MSAWYIKIESSSYPELSCYVNALGLRSAYEPERDNFEGINPTYRHPSKRDAEIALKSLQERCFYNPNLLSLIERAQRAQIVYK